MLSSRNMLKTLINMKVMLVQLNEVLRKASLLCMVVVGYYKDCLYAVIVHLLLGGLEKNINRKESHLAEDAFALILWSTR